MTHSPTITNRFWILLFPIIIGCSSSPKMKTQVEDSTPESAIQELQTALNRGSSDQLDVLASQDFSKAQQCLSIARGLLNSKADAEEIKEELLAGHDFLQKAEQTGEVLRHKVTLILMARKKALEAGAKTFDPTLSELEKVDFRFKAELKRVDPQELEKVAQFQKSYLDIEDQVIKSKGISATAKISDIGTKKKRPPSVTSL